MNTHWTTLAAAALIAAAISYHATAQRYQLAGNQDGFIALRLDRLTGEVSRCYQGCKPIRESATP